MSFGGQEINVSYRRASDVSLCYVCIFAIWDCMFLTLELASFHVYTKAGCFDLTKTCISDFYLDFITWNGCLDQELVVVCVTQGIREGKLWLERRLAGRCVRDPPPEVPPPLCYPIMYQLGITLLESVSCR